MTGRVSRGDASRVPTRRMEALPAIEVADPFDTFAQVLGTVIIGAAHVLHLVFQVDEIIAGCSLVLSGLAGAHVEGLDNLVVVVYGCGLLRTVDHDLPRNFLLFSVKLRDIAGNCQRR